MNVNVSSLVVTKCMPNSAWIMGLDASAYKRSVILVSVCIVFIRLFVFIIVWISCVEIRMRKLTFRSPKTIMLKDISSFFQWTMSKSTTKIWWAIYTENKVFTSLWYFHKISVLLKYLPNLLTNWLFAMTRSTSCYTDKQHLAQWNIQIC